MNQTCDVAIIGGGPAGAAAGTLLAKAGRRVTIFEKEKFPRFRIGESMLPASSDTLERMGVKSKIDAGGFLIKYGGEISSACGTARAEFLFRNGLNARRPTAYQVERSKFDLVLLDHARESGCTVYEETPVRSVTWDEEGVTLGCDEPGPPEVRAQYVLDCSGRDSLLANHLKLKEPYPELRKFSVFAYYRGVKFRDGERGTLTRMIRGDDRWFWMIPLHGGKASIGVVMDVGKFRDLRSKPVEVLDACIREQPELNQWMQEAERITPVYATSDLSYRVARLSGERWLLAGDAAGFIDPVFSSGVYIALFSGEKAADTLDRVLSAPASRSEAFRTYEKAVERRLKGYLKLSRSWYTAEFVEVFLHPREMFKLVPTVNAVLSGNASSKLAMKWRMQFFFLLVYLQGKCGRLVPRLSFQPK